MCEGSFWAQRAGESRTEDRGEAPAQRWPETACCRFKKKKKKKKKGEFKKKKKKKKKTKKKKKKQKLYTTMRAVKCEVCEHNAPAAAKCVLSSRAVYLCAPCARAVQAHYPTAARCERCQVCLFFSWCVLHLCLHVFCLYISACMRACVFGWRACVCLCACGSGIIAENRRLRGCSSEPHSAFAYWANRNIPLDNCSVRVCRLVHRADCCARCRDGQIHTFFSCRFVCPLARQDKENTSRSLSLRTCGSLVFLNSFA